jgi:Na+/H+ antiporter NhaC
MRSKFRANFAFVMPAAVVTLLVYAFSGNGLSVVDVPQTTWGDAFKCIPYIIVIVAALFGVNVLLVLVMGIVAAALLGLCYGVVGGIDVFTEMGGGVVSMGELIVVTMLAGGLLELVRLAGGIDFLIRVATGRVSSQRGAELSICALTAFPNVCTANNTIAILTVGDIARNLSHEYRISPRRAASLMDTTSCFVQGVIPYGAQLLMASGLAAVSPLEIIPYLYYPMAVGVAMLLTVFVRGRKVEKQL